MVRLSAVTAAFRLRAHSPENREKKVRSHLQKIDGVAPIVDTLTFAHTGKDISRGLRTAYRTRAFVWVGASGALWVASLLFPPVVPLATVAALLPIATFAEEWRVSERTVHRQKKQELIRLNEGKYRLVPGEKTREKPVVFSGKIASIQLPIEQAISNENPVNVIKKTYLTVKQAKIAFKKHVEYCLQNHPELRTVDNPFARKADLPVERPYAIPFQHKRHRITVYTVQPQVARTLFEQSRRLYAKLFLQPAQ